MGPINHVLNEGPDLSTKRVNFEGEGACRPIVRYSDLHFWRCAVHVAYLRLSACTPVVGADAEQLEHAADEFIFHCKE